MPTITAQGKIYTCETGENLRTFCQKNGINLHNGNSKIINCRGLGTCGTCAVEITGEVSQPNWKEKARLSLPPHKGDGKLRLACQTTILGDIEVKKYTGFWGQESTRNW